MIIENLNLTEKAFARALTLNNLIDNVIPLLSPRLGGGRAGDIRACMAIYNLTSLGKRIFSFDEYKFKTSQFDGERTLSKQQTQAMLDAIRDAGITYTDKKGRNFIRRRLFQKLDKLVNIYDKQTAQELEAVSCF